MSSGEGSHGDVTHCRPGSGWGHDVKRRGGQWDGLDSCYLLTVGEGAPVSTHRLFPACKESAENALRACCSVHEFSKQVTLTQSNIPSLHDPKVPPWSQNSFS